MLIRDPDAERRRTMIERATPRLGPVPGLSLGRIEHGNTTVLWTANVRAPISTFADEDGAAVVFGDAIPPHASARLSARDLADRWRPHAPDQAYDGFYAAAVVRPQEILVGSDLLGLFPVYYAASGDVLLAGSAHNLFTCHPLFTGDVDVEGLFGHLLLAGPFNGRTIRREARRLGPGTRLQWHCEHGAREEVTFALPDGRADGSGDPREAAEQLGDALRNAVRRHTDPYRSIALQLSGGRDSRLLAGYLTRSGRSATAVTFGQHTDHEVNFASRVASTLQLPHIGHDIPFERFGEFADRSVRCEQLSAGMSSIHTWGNGDAFGDAEGVLAGYLMELRHVDLGGLDRQEVLRRSFSHGLSPEQLIQMLRDPEARRVVRDLQATITSDYDRIAPTAADRRCRWLLNTYMRFHAGSVPWRLSFFAWPILPVLDQELLRVTFALPEPWLQDRAMQELVLCNEFPVLARLPFDRNSVDTRPLIETPMDRMLRRGRERAAAFLARTRVQRRAHIERKFYWRMYNFDNAGWRDIRRAAEPGRAALFDLFDPGALSTLVPSPETTCNHGEPVARGYAPKLLTGLMRWHMLRDERT